MIIGVMGECLIKYANKYIALLVLSFEAFLSKSLENLVSNVGETISNDYFDLSQQNTLIQTLVPYSYDYDDFKMVYQQVL